MDLHTQLDDPFVNSDSLYSALISSITSNGLTTFDLLKYANSPNRATSSINLAKRLGRSIREIDTFLDIIKEKADNSIESKSVSFAEEYTDEDESEENEASFAPTGLSALDNHLGGGIPMGEITEVFGSSGSGKSQFLFYLSMQWQILKQKRNHKNKCIYISTESPLQTARLQSIAKSIPGTLLENITYVYCPDLESQDHIIQTQLPVLLKTSGQEYGLIIVDSISHHLRREDAISNVTSLQTKIKEQEEKLNPLFGYAGIKKNMDSLYDSFFRSTANYKNFTARTRNTIELYNQLQRMAKDYKIAIVVANQVGDTFESDKNADAVNKEFEDVCLSYNAQLPFVYGWDLKTTLNYLHKTDDTTIPNALYADLMRSFHGTRKRRKLEDMEENDPRYSKTSHRLSQEQIDLINSLHEETGAVTKKYVAALGYPWSRRITTRILCMKTYRPSIKAPENVDPETGMTYEQLCAGFEVPQDDAPPSLKVKPVAAFNSNLPKTLPDLVDSWNVERFFRVVVSTHSLHKKFNILERIPFSVDSSGIKEEI